MIIQICQRLLHLTLSTIGTQLKDQFMMKVLFLWLNQLLKAIMALFSPMGKQDVAKLTL
jgi:hypothetical protein